MSRQRVDALVVYALIPAVVAFIDVALGRTLLESDRSLTRALGLMRATHVALLALVFLLALAWARTRGRASPAL